MRRLPLTLLVALALLTACDSNNNAGTTVNFVGNSTCDTSGQSPYSPSPPNTNTTPVGQSIDEMPHYHVAQGTQITYMHNPPTSGCHYSLGSGTSPLKPGIYLATSATKLTPQYWVHNLEHGYVVVTYNCPNGCDADLQTLQSWFVALPPDAGAAVPYAKFIAVPDTAQKEKFDVLSWDWFDPRGSTLNLNEIKKFYACHTNQAPEGAKTP
ncbi:MAG TPA: DUF3105 domain-containing protein [Candidatus Deferrimicrobium sp.]|nr:DUF3105 domain-containing protein [Candidatus Deferrimicrobium sp.]